MKNIILILFLFSVILCDQYHIFDTFQGGNCVSRTFGIEGEACIPGFNSTKTCKNFLACRNGKCTKAHIGSPCNLDADCYASNPNYGGVRCVDKKCVKPRFNGLGCYDPKHCWSGVCSGGRCIGSPLGADCDPTKLSCDAGYYCSSSTKKCEYQKELGDYCSDYYMEDKPENQIPVGSNFNVICMGGLKCSGPFLNKYCISWKQGYEGTPCNRDRDGDDTCRFGLRCSGLRRMCVNDAEDFPSWRCNGSPRNCTYENEEECVCQSGRGACLRVYDLQKCNFNDAANVYRDCIEANNCAYERSALLSMEINALDPETCVGKFCSADVLRTVCCGYEKYITLNYSPANMPPFCSPGNPGLAVFLVLFFLCLCAISLATIFGIVGFVVYYFMRRKADGGDGIYNTKGDFQNLE